jgi:hypothetical protein
MAMAGHFIFGQDAEPAHTGLKGRESDLALDQHGRQLNLATPRTA